MLKNGLTEEQARNIATDEDAILILAGAGTGKTAAITGLIHEFGSNTNSGSTTSQLSRRRPF